MLRTNDTRQGAWKDDELFLAIGTCAFRHPRLTPFMSAIM